MDTQVGKDVEGLKWRSARVKDFLHRLHEMAPQLGMTVVVPREIQSETDLDELIFSRTAASFPRTAETSSLCLFFSDWSLHREGEEETTKHSPLALLLRQKVAKNESFPMPLFWVDTKWNEQPYSLQLTAEEAEFRDPDRQLKLSRKRRFLWRTGFKTTFRVDVAIRDNAIRSWMEYLPWPEPLWAQGKDHAEMGRIFDVLHVPRPPLLSNETHSSRSYRIRMWHDLTYKAVQMHDQEWVQRARRACVDKKTPPTNVEEVAQCFVEGRLKEAQEKLVNEAVESLKVPSTKEMVRDAEQQANEGGGAATRLSDQQRDDWTGQAGAAMVLLQTQLREESNQSKEQFKSMIEQVQLVKAELAKSLEDQMALQTRMREEAMKLSGSSSSVPPSPPPGPEGPGGDEKKAEEAHPDQVGWIRWAAQMVQKGFTNVAQFTAYLWNTCKRMFKTVLLDHPILTSVILRVLILMRNRVRKSVEMNIKLSLHTQPDPTEAVTLVSTYIESGGKMVGTGAERAADYLRYIATSSLHDSVTRTLGLVWEFAARGIGMMDTIVTTIGGWFGSAFDLIGLGFVTTWVKMIYNIFKEFARLVKDTLQQVSLEVFLYFGFALLLGTLYTVGAALLSPVQFLAHPLVSPNLFYSASKTIVTTVAVFQFYDLLGCTEVIKDVLPLFLPATTVVV